MAESKEVIHDRMLKNISDEYDKTEGSFFYDATKPVAIELEQRDSMFDNILNCGFVDTATGIYLERICIEQGIYRKQATKATGQVVIIGAASAKINKNDKVASDTVNFVFMEDKVIDSSGQATVNVECEMWGSIGNVPVGAIKYFPVTLSALVSVTNNNAITNGYDGESDEELRQRYYDKVRTPATSGNKWHYKSWAKEVVGVGNVRVFPLWKGNGTVKVIIINSNKRAADERLINEVSAHIEDNRPIGATVTVVSAIEKQINVSATLIIDTKKYTLNQVQTDIEANLTNYYKEIAFKNNYVSYANIGNILFNTEGVIDYSKLLVNGSTANITIVDEEVAVFGTVSLEV